MLHELGCLLLAFTLAEIDEVEGQKPVHEPKFDHKQAVDLALDLLFELELILVTQPILSSHLSKLEPVVHLLERALD